MFQKLCELTDVKTIKKHMYGKAVHMLLCYMLISGSTVDEHYI